MIRIGCHLSTAEGYTRMGETALGIGADTFQFFTRNPRGYGAKPLIPEDVAGLKSLQERHRFADTLAHSPYTLNPCSADPKVREFAERLFTEDLQRMEQLPCRLYNFHPGSHTGQGIETGIRLISELLDRVMWEDMKTVILLETMSGKGSEVGSSFTELQAILEQTRLKDRLGVCLDTCHLYSAGYDIVNRLEEVLEELDRTVGLHRVHAVHLNDSMTPFASRKDRHARIGEGSIGTEALVRFITHPSLRHLPFLLETPNELEGYAEEIRMLRELCA